MRIVAIGDIHGSQLWKNVVNSEKFDKVVFVGDYSDSFDIYVEDQINNLLDITKYASAYPASTEMLIGNHDYHYIPSIRETYSGFNMFVAHDLGRLYSDLINSGILKVAYSYENFLFSHAGITKQWCKKVKISTRIPLESIVREVNDLLLYKPQKLGFSPGRLNDIYGDEPCQSPIWVRPNSLRMSMLEDVTYVCGHTQQHSIKVEPGLVLIDTLGSSKEYIVIENGEIEIKKIQNA